MTADARQWLAGFTAAVDSRDLDRLVSFFTPDAEFTYGNNPAMVGHDGIRAGIGAFFAGISAISHEVVGSHSPDPSVVVAEFRTTYTRLDGVPVTLPGAGVLELDGDRIRLYRVYADVAPVFAPAA
ncbi:nuclear transport factor 2 family protein [Kineosporia sp. R_H_3]|uniref:nuclear transport factor 2 family protein n=1 Tax=Kineosporia sp. R_H_3 TaxID=1961848 RepID=UPI000B4B29D8|nr:nuclear transport factor 2 family protein [Kineosporia sp. R_H_3]